MDVVKHAVAGTMESSDIFLEVSPSSQGIDIELSSIVMHQFGDAIKQVIIETLAQMQVKNVHIRANDRGALDCVIRARLETALLRCAKEAE